MQSYHKDIARTLTMWDLFIHKDAPLKDEIVRYLGYFQTSSPSYLVMASLEHINFMLITIVRYFLRKERKLIDTLNMTD